MKVIQIEASLCNMSILTYRSLASKNRCVELIKEKGKLCSGFGTGAIETRGVNTHDE